MRLMSVPLTALCLAVLVGCAGSPIQTSRRATENRKAMINVRPDMSVEEVMRVMGPPDKTELWRGKNEEAVLLYLYITEGKDIVTRQWNESNYTPFVFVSNRLHSWGWDQFQSLAQRYELVIKNR
jgi:uncharacterized protein DUF3192